MESNEEESRKKGKATFYFQEKLECHVIKDPKGFVNGFFKSDLIDGKYYWFENRLNIGVEKRLFLCDIFDINDYEVKE